MGGSVATYVNKHFRLKDLHLGGWCTVYDYCLRWKL